ncbi:MAG: hypothetical protein Q9162_004380 [Coniocarpon cinnabarinum]
MSHVYDTYHRTFESLRRMPEVRTLQENDNLCRTLQTNLRQGLTIIPRLVMGVLETQHLMDADKMDNLINILLRSRISRRVILEQHLALTETFHSPWHFEGAPAREDQTDVIGEVLLRCNVRASIRRCAAAVEILLRQAYGAHVELPEVRILGHTDATLTYIPSHLEYIIGELLRNSFQACIEKHRESGTKPTPVEVLICEAPQHVILRVSDQGGGIPQSILPYLWSFIKGPRRQVRLENLNKVPELAATLEELRVPETERLAANDELQEHRHDPDSSLSSLTGRPPNLRLGIGLPMSRVYAEFWAGSLQLHSLEGYGVDAFLQISKLGNKNEQLVTRAVMDAV